MADGAEALAADPLSPAPSADSPLKGLESEPSFGSAKQSPGSAPASRASSFKEAEAEEALLPERAAGASPYGWNLLRCGRCGPG